MAVRSPQGQFTHDAVIAAREKQWKAYKQYVQSWTNPNGRRNASYKLNGVEQFPDLIIGVNVNGETRYGIEEVETVDSVNNAELAQWRAYSALNRSWSNLLVPREAVPTAQRLCKGLSLSIVGYSRSASGEYAFDRGVKPAQ